MPSAQPGDGAIGSVVIDLDPEDVISAGPVGAVPPLGGVAARDGDAAADEGSRDAVVTEQLTDALELLLRALRALQGSVDAELERSAQQAFFTLQRLAAEQHGPKHELAKAERDAAAEQLSELVREIIGALERL